ncbi:MAG: type II 3-dehydroquinate dehydratase [Clostridia bacterium]|nr:type II 3-dehydroquinate dehydratase [Clostridia bacterium]
MKFVIINGPNLNMLGIREPGIYGSDNYETLLNKIKTKADEMDVSVEFFQSNHEGAIIDKIQECYGNTDGIVINPGAYTHYSYAIHDALKSVMIPTVEVHISDIHSREEFRRISVTAPACIAQISGKGLDGYLLAMEELVNAKA